MKTFIFLTLVSVCLSVSTITYTFPTGNNNLFYPPTYPLGLLNATDIIRLTIQVQNFVDFQFSASALSVQIKNSLNNQIIFSQNMTPGRTSTFTTSVPSSGNYQISVTPTIQTSNPTTFVAYNLYVQANNNAILQISDIARNNILKQFYLSNPWTQVTFIYPAGAIYLTLYSLNMADSTPNKVTNTVSLLATSVDASGVASSVNNLPNGTYILQVNVVDALAYGRNLNISYVTDPYPCPYNPLYSDYYSVYAGCVPQNNFTGLPCLRYDVITQSCTLCSNGYNLINGRCVTTLNCGPRQYVQFGVCKDVSITCLTFDISNGNCLSCNSSAYILFIGQCILANPDNTNNNNGSSTNPCISSNPVTLLCVLCNSGYVLSNGSCISTTCSSNTYFSISRLSCQPYPSNCLNFSTALETCYSCSVGYTLVSGTCQLLNSNAYCLVYNANINVCYTCIEGYYLLAGICLPTGATSSCLLYNNAGICISCAPGFNPQGTGCSPASFTPQCAQGFQFNSQGVCVPITPISCLTGQVLVNGRCVAANCNNTNPITNECIQCVANYILINGLCNLCSGGNPNYPCVYCPIGQYVGSNGSCVNVSSECGNYNPSNGFCTTCISGTQPINGVCCAINQQNIGGVCRPRQ